MNLDPLHLYIELDDKYMIEHKPSQKAGKYISSGMQ